MHVPPLGRGAVVVIDGPSALLLWTIAGDGAWRALPVMPRTRPLHRAHVELAPDEAADLGLRRLASIIATDDPAAIVLGRSCGVLGQCTESLIVRIAMTIRRSQEAAQFENRAMTAFPWADMIGA